jgi:fructose-1-phosphate kinase PfkB-like protein
MLLFFTPNPCIERTLFVDEWAPHQSLRIQPEQVQISAGGKGLNASRVAAKFGAASVSLAPVGRLQRAYLDELFAHERIEARWIEVDSSTRTSTNIVDSSGSTEWVEAGEAPSIEAGTRILEAWRELIPKCDLALIGGSYPSSADTSWNAHATILCSLARAANKKLIYDGKGEPFGARSFRRRRPSRSNRIWTKCANCCGATSNRFVDERRAIRDVMKRGIELVLLSCGSRGLYVGFQNQIEWFRAPEVKEISAVGSGDSLVGAFAAKWVESGDVWEAARWGVAAGAANAARLDVGHVGPDEAEKLLPNVKREIVEIELMAG